MFSTCFGQQSSMAHRWSQKTTLLAAHDCATYTAAYSCCKNSTLSLIGLRSPTCRLCAEPTSNQQKLLLASPLALTLASEALCVKLLA
ncbi:hypothetical protein SRHO_G00253070 [Serrasalmus rhombeus]